MDEERRKKGLEESLGWRTTVEVDRGETQIGVAADDWVLTNWQSVRVTKTQ